MRRILTMQWLQRRTARLEGDDENDIVRFLVAVAVRDELRRAAASIGWTLDAIEAPPWRP